MLGRNAMVTKVVTEIGTGRILERRLRWTELPFAKLMGVRFPTVASTTFIGPLPANATETAVLTTPGLNLPIDNAQVLLFFMAVMTAGTSVTSHVFRIRRGTTTGGTLVGAAGWSQTIAAAAFGTSSGWYADSPGVAAEQQYTLTVVQTAATVAGTWTDGSLIAVVL
jgi:hypothetical protein